MRYRVVIPVLNQLAYTQQCVASLLAGGTPAEALLVIDNGSSDDTPAWLASRPDVPSLRNRINLGCGGAWTQGALAALGAHDTGASDAGQDSSGIHGSGHHGSNIHGSSGSGTDSSRAAQWVVLLNNDVVACDHMVDRLLDAAERHGLQAVSPSLVEGPLDYDFAAHARTFTAAMAGTLRAGWFHGVAFAVQRRVFERIGFPDTDRQLGGREDVEFLVRCRRHGVPVGTVGDALLHHFGSITQKALKQDSGRSDLGDRDHFYAKLGMGWFARKRFKRERRAQARAWVAAERAAHGHVMHMQRQDGRWIDVDYL